MGNNGGLVDSACIGERGFGVRNRTGDDLAAWVAEETLPIANAQFSSPACGNWTPYHGMRLREIDVFCTDAKMNAGVAYSAAMPDVGVEAGHRGAALHLRLPRLGGDQREPARDRGRRRLAGHPDYDDKMKQELVATCELDVPA